jgi:hypothetical protein
MRITKLKLKIKITGNACETEYGRLDRLGGVKTLSLKFRKAVEK